MDDTVLNNLLSSDLYHCRLHSACTLRIHQEPESLTHFLGDLRSLMAIRSTLIKDAWALIPDDFRTA